MRTTIDIPDAQRARLLRLAAERGEKGFSRLVQEAIESYLEGQGDRSARVEAAVRLKGTLGAKAGEALASAAREARRSWR